MAGVRISRAGAVAALSLLLALLVVAGERLTGAGAAEEAPAAAPLEEVAPAPARTALVVHVVG
ncbi:MAG TPA: hypothetical protein VNJ46_09415, partial [Gaiellaceae bacterium]|nr:hypothetical protein [Gaiellaceae bacterium]